MLLTESQIDGLNVACNEATWVGLEVNQNQSWVGITLAVLSLPVDGPPPEDPRVKLILQPLSRLCASYRSGLWNDDNAEVLPLTIDQLERKVLQRQGSIYGWEFFNIPDEKGFAPWAHRLSIDTISGAQQPLNSINLFQDENPFLEVRIWFGELRIFGPNRKEISLQDFIDGGQRWWDGMYTKDPRTNGAGIFPIDPKKEG